MVRTAVAVSLVITRPARPDFEEYGGAKHFCVLEQLIEVNWSCDLIRRVCYRVQARKKKSFRQGCAIYFYTDTCAVTR